MSKDSKPKPLVSPAVLFGAQIDTALADGVSAKAMTLRLTLSDGRRLRRDDKVPLDQISYLGGQMHFRGVRVVEGGVGVSILDQVSA
jgi:hypothetical protein